LNQIQNELAASHPQLRIKILAINERGQESGNVIAVAGRTLPLLQDVDADFDGTSDTWFDWSAQWRDLVVVDVHNREVGRLNLSSFDLAQPANYASLKQALIDTAAMSLYPPAPTCSAADLDGDNRITAADLRWFTQSLGSTVATPGMGADFDRDGRVTVRDLVRLRQFFGQTCSAASPAAPQAAIAVAHPTETLSLSRQLRTRATDMVFARSVQSEDLSASRRAGVHDLPAASTPAQSRLTARRNVATGQRAVDSAQQTRLSGLTIH
jgi:hypothetical protein